MSIGGNDADLVGILNAYVYSFWGGLSYPNCDRVLELSRSLIESNDFSSRLDGLLSLTKSKLGDHGRIYYTRYAKLFDTTNITCDKVSWHIWLNLFTREYLTQRRRNLMNDLVHTMNEALRAAVERAGPQVHFIDYDEYVGLSRGRYCQPKQDESAGKGANLAYSFFYQIKIVDSPWTTKDEEWDHDELKRRQSDGDLDDLPVNNGTLNALYGAMIQQTLRDEQEYSGESAALEDDNADLDLQAEVDEAEDEFEKSICDLPTRSPPARSSILLKEAIR
ncbi:hypothetical protein WHR41_09415 [Cladosporium halotolerans]|uniref:Uncharacterized protein n=1 Tax=Cladosporium halotolerans TaxID=1052096 RepID=A0AB34KD77_9PEZI